MLLFVHAGFDTHDLERIEPTGTCHLKIAGINFSKLLAELSCASPKPRSDHRNDSRSSDSRSSDDVPLMHGSASDTERHIEREINSVAKSFKLTRVQDEFVANATGKMFLEVIKGDDRIRLGGFSLNGCNARLAGSI